MLHCSSIPDAHSTNSRALLALVMEVTTEWVSPYFWGLHDSTASVSCFLRGTPRSLKSLSYFSRLEQQFRNFRKIQAPSQNTRRQEGDTKQVPCWGPWNIWRHLRKRSQSAIKCPVFMHSGVRTSPVYMKLEFASPFCPVLSQFIPVNSCQTSWFFIRSRNKPRLSNWFLICILSNQRFLFRANFPYSSYTSRRIIRLRSIVVTIPA